MARFSHLEFLCSGEAGFHYFGTGLSSLKSDVSYLPGSSQDVSVGGRSRHTYSTVWDKLAVDYDNISYPLRGGKKIGEIIYFFKILSVRQFIQKLL
jgi:hypothetical protein